MLWPGPGNILRFKALPGSVRSTQSGDTTEIPNVVGYFSHNFRSFVIPFYKSNYQQNSHFPFPPLRLNHPPEYSWSVIKKHTETTYLEEFIYPLRDSVYINGYEIFRPDGSPIFFSVPRLEEGGQSFPTKVTLRFYPSNILVRFLVWLGTVYAMILITKLGRKIITE